jgi:hypothetical protein
MSPKTLKSARDRLSLLPKFVKEHYRMTVDQFVEQIKEKKLDGYQVLAKFAVYLKRDLGKSDDRVRKMVTIAKLFLEHHDTEFGERTFRARVKLPRTIQRLRKTAIDREDIITILQAASNQQNLQVAILWMLP